MNYWKDLSYAMDLICVKCNDDNARESQKIQQSMWLDGHLPVLLLQATEIKFK